METADLERLARQHGIILLLQFGSSVTGRQHQASDIDLAVQLDRIPDSYAAQTDLAADLQRLFPSREVDVALVNTADPLFLQQITSACRLLFGSPRRLQELKIYAFKRYQDHRRFLAMERAYVERTIQAFMP